MSMDSYLSADELYRYLHVSKRKLKFLLENGYIPCTDTGKKTHRFLIKTSQAEEFKRKMDTEPRFLCELDGKFSSRACKPQENQLDPTIQDRRAFEQFLARKWADQPNALSTKAAAELIGCIPQRVGEWMRKGIITSVNIRGVRYCSKVEFIAHCTSPGMLARAKMPGYRKLIAEFMLQSRPL